MNPKHAGASESKSAVHKMIRDKFLPRVTGYYTERDVEIAARYMSKTLRIGGIKVCRQMVWEAIDG